MLGNPDIVLVWPTIVTELDAWMTPRGASDPEHVKQWEEAGAQEMLLAPVEGARLLAWGKWTVPQGANTMYEYWAVFARHGPPTLGFFDRRTGCVLPVELPAITDKGLARIAEGGG